MTARKGRGLDNDQMRLEVGRVRAIQYFCASLNARPMATMATSTIGKWR